MIVQEKNIITITTHRFKRQCSKKELFCVPKEIKQHHTILFLPQMGYYYCCCCCRWCTPCAIPGINFPTSPDERTGVKTSIAPQPRGCQNRPTRARKALGGIFLQTPFSAMAASWLCNNRAFKNRSHSCALTRTLTVCASRLNCAGLSEFVSASSSRYRIRRGNNGKQTAAARIAAAAPGLVTQGHG